MAGKKGQKILKKHEDSPRFAEYYKKENPEWTIEQCEEKAKWFRRSCNYQCIEYYEKNYPELSHEEHLKLKDQLKLQKNQNKETNIEYWKNKYPEKSLEELEQLRSKAAKIKNKQNLEYWINKYPQKDLEEIKKMHQEYYQSWLSHQEGWGKGDKNNNSKNNSTLEERKSKSPKCIEFYERRYPELSHEEHLKLLNEHINEVNLKLTPDKRTTNIEYYLNQGMSEEEAKQALHDRQATFTYEKCIKKYGEMQGNIIFSNRQQKWLKKLYENFQSNGDGRSKQSQFANNIIKECCKILKISIPKKEKYLYWKKTHQAFAYDFVYQNKIIEFQGDYWHCNPILYKSNFYNKVKQKTAQEIWNYDNIKKECAEHYGYNILYVWEYDYNNNEEETLKKCIDFLIND